MTKPIAVRHIERAPQATIDQLGSQGVATVHEAMGRSGLLEPEIRPIYSGASIAGSAVTILSQPGDNWMLHVAMELCQPGDVLIVGCTVRNTDGMFGELLATAAMTHGVVGLVTDTGVRDVADLEQMRFPVWSRAISARGTVNNTLGSVNIPMVCAGQLVNPGDVVVADDDGVVVVPRKTADAVAAAGQKRLDKEAITRRALASGQLGIDYYGMRSRLEEAGLRYVESAADIEVE